MEEEREEEEEEEEDELKSRSLSLVTISDLEGYVRPTILRENWKKKKFNCESVRWKTIEEGTDWRLSGKEAKQGETRSIDTRVKRKVCRNLTLERGNSRKLAGNPAIKKPGLAFETLKLVQ